MGEQGSAPATDPVVRGHVEDVLRRLLRDDELDAWQLRWELNDAGRWQLVADVTACGERYVGFIAELDADYPLEAGLDAFTDGLEDFISESRFAWSEQRELRDRPWRRE